jgi:hypothetical protein
VRLESFEVAHIQGGRNPIRMSGEPDLEGNVPLWRALWERHRDGLLSEWIARHPGSRPPAWWAFDAPGPQPDGESEVQYLHRLGSIDVDELKAIRARAIELVRYDRGRNPIRTPGGYHPDNYIPATDLHIFAAKEGLLTAEERSILWLDARGEDVFEGPRETGRTPPETRFPAGKAGKNGIFTV